MLASRSAARVPIAPHVRAIVIDGHALFGRALTHVLASDPAIDVLCDARSVAGADLRALRPDLIVLDLDGHQGELAATLQSCRDQAPGVRVCVLSAHAQPDVMQRCLQAGADGFVAKDVLPAELVRAVTTVAEGDPYVDSRVAGRVLARRVADGRSVQHDLSARETEIVRLIARGRSNKESGGELGVSEKTVKNHISRIFAKLKITARAQAAAYAIRTGLA